MTRLSALHMPPPAPPSVLLGELAAAAGVAGRSIALLFEDYAGPALGELWKYFARRLGPNEIIHVYSQADVRRFETHLAGIRLVFVHTPRLHDAVMWCVHMAPSVPGEIVPRPTVFGRRGPEDSDTTPGATLVLRSDPRELAAINQWSLLAGQAAPDWDIFQTPAGIQVAPELIPLVAFDSSQRAAGVRGIRNRHVLQGLLVGAGLRRSCRQASWTGDTVQANLQDYGLVRRLLQSRLVSLPDVSVDRIAVTMVKRANVYLDVQYAPHRTDENPFQADDYYDREGPVSECRGRPLVTRREIADLGNIRSGMVRRLIEQLQQRSDGFELFGRMGLVHRRPDPGEWMRTPASRLAGLLRPWTVKQVRTYFEQFQKSGLITAERDPRNGPWRYLLPEELSATGAAFANLPPVEQLGPQHPAQAAG